MDETDTPPVPARDRDSWSLLLRTSVALVTTGLVGWTVGSSIAHVLESLARPSLARYLRPVRMVLPDAVPPAPGVTLVVVAALAATVVFPFLFNPRWLSRRTVSLAGLVHVLLAMGLLGLVNSAVQAVTGLFATASPGRPLPATGLVPQLVAAGLGVALLFVLLGETTLGGAPDRLVARGVPRRTLLVAGLTGMVVGVGLAVVGHLLLRWNAILFRALWGFLGESAEASPLGMARLRLALCLELGLLAAATSSLLVATAPARVRAGGRVLAIGVALLPAAALVVAGVRFEGYCRSRGLDAPLLSQAARIEAPPAARLMVLPREGGLVVHRHPLVATVLGGESEQSVGATRRNLERVQDLITREQGRWTWHTTPAWAARAAILDALLDPAAAVLAQVEAAEATGNLLQSQLALARVAGMPLAPPVREAATRLLDPARFRATGAVNGKLVAVALALGRLEQAHALWQRRGTGAPRAGDEIAEPVAVPPRTGIVRGRLVPPLPGARVALYRHPDRRLPARVPHLIRLVAATDPDADGSFRFEALPFTRYLVGVLCPASSGSDIEAVTATGALGPVEPDGTAPEVDLGPIAIQVAPR